MRGRGGAEGWERRGRGGAEEGGVRSGEEQEIREDSGRTKRRLQLQPPNIAHDVHVRAAADERKAGVVVVLEQLLCHVTKARHKGREGSLQYTLTGAVKHSNGSRRALHTKTGDSVAVQLEQGQPDDRVAPGLHDVACNCRRDNLILVVQEWVPI